MLGCMPRAIPLCAQTVRPKGLQGRLQAHGTKKSARLVRNDWFVWEWRIFGTTPCSLMVWPHILHRPWATPMICARILSPTCPSSTITVLSRTYL